MALLVAGVFLFYHSPPMKGPMMANTSIALSNFLNPIDAKRRETITKKLEDEGITRLTIERGNECQTLRHTDQGWKINAQHAGF